MRRMLNAGSLPSVVFCANDEMALGAIHTVHEAGLRVPEDIGVIGFDDVPMAVFASPPLTTIRHPVDLIARNAASALIAKIERGEPIGRKCFPGELIERQSVLPLSEMAISRRKMA
jgi:DNA-binding LacI/PurR family transcriptional regulator